MLKLGSSCICPLTGVRGTVVTFRRDMPIGRAPDGKLFKAKVRGGLKRGPKKRYFLARVRDENEVLSHWLKAKLLDSGLHLLFGDPVFAGAEVEASTLEFAEDDDA